jgi:hypothetical protein
VNDLERDPNARADSGEVILRLIDYGETAVHENADIWAKAILDAEARVAFQQSVAVVPVVIVAAGKILPINALSIEHRASADLEVRSDAARIDWETDKDIQRSLADYVLVSAGIEQRAFHAQPDVPLEKVVHPDAAAPRMIADEAFLIRLGEGVSAEEIDLPFTIAEALLHGGLVGARL